MPKQRARARKGLAHIVSGGNVVGRTPCAAVNQVSARCSGTKEPLERTGSLG